MGSHLSGRRIKPSTKFNEKFEEMFVPNVAITKHQILVSAGSTGGFLKVALADADTDGHMGVPLFLAMSDGAIDPNDANAPKGKMVRRGVITGVNTGAATPLDPVYLSSTAGDWTLTRPTPPVNVRRIGTVIAVDATDGEILFDGGLDAGDVLFGSATVVSGQTSIVVAVGTRWNGKLAVISLAEAPTAASSWWAGPVAAGNLTISIDINNTADLDFHYALGLM